MYHFPWLVTAFITVWSGLKSWWRNSLVVTFAVVGLILLRHLFVDVVQAGRQRFYGALAWFWGRLGSDVLALASEAKAEHVRVWRRKAVTSFRFG